MTLVIVLTIWSALLMGITQMLKRGLEIHLERSERPSRCEHIIDLFASLAPFVLGGLTGAYILPAAMLEIDLEHFAKLPRWVYAVLGLGAGAVAGQSYKVLKSALRALRRSGILGNTPKGERPDEQ